MRKVFFIILCFSLFYCGVAFSLDAEKERDLKTRQQEYLKEANTVVITSRGKKYHKPDCQTIKGKYKTLTVKEARKKGYKPCKVCEPPEAEVTLENCRIYWGDDVYGK